MKTMNCAALIMAALSAGCYAQTTQPESTTVAYWRFESATAGRAVSPDRVIEDVSGHGNHLRTFDPGTAPTFVETTHWKFVPQTRRANRVAIDNTARSEQPFPTRDLFLAPESSSFDLVKGELPQWTIEASVNFKSVEGWDRRWQTFVGRDGYNVPNRDALHEDPLSNLGFKRRGDNGRISIEAFDSTGTYVTAQSKEPVKPDAWYDVAAASDGKTLRLYVKGPDDAEMRLQDEKPFHGALANGGGGWTVGRGCFGFDPSEQMFGLIDEVRISNVALPPAQFLATPSATGYVPESEAAAPTTSLASTRAVIASAQTPSTLIHPHDPVLVRSGNSFHVLASHGGLFHWRSPDLVHWQSLPSIMKSAPQWSIDSVAADPGIWAPDLEFFNGKWHLYYSLSRFGSQRSAIGLMTSPTLEPEDPNYAWKDEGAVVESFPRMDFNAIDPAIVLDRDGTPWLAWGSFNKGIYLSRVDAKTGKLVGETTQIAARPGNTALEAPDLFYREGYYYLIVSYDFCCRGSRSTYKLVVGRSEKITGPYLSRDGKPMLNGEATLLMRTHDFFAGPGQSSVIERDGKFILAHHYYDTRRNGEPTLAVRDLCFDHEGWPMPGPAYAEVGEAAVFYAGGRFGVQVDDAEAGNIEVGEAGQITGAFGPGTLVVSQSSGHAELRWNGGFADQSADCVISSDGRTLVGRNKRGQILRLQREEPVK